MAMTSMSASRAGSSGVRQAPMIFPDLRASTRMVRFPVQQRKGKALQERYPRLFVSRKALEVTK